MENNINLKKKNINLFFKATISLVLLLFISCDFSYELVEADSKEDLKPPTAFFGASVRGEDQWNQVDFVNGSVSASSYIWDFGDGSDTSTDIEPNHSYPPFEAAYTVKLIVSDDNGLTDTFQGTVNIIPDPDNPLTDYNLFFELINIGDAGEPVTINSFSSFQESKDAFPSNTLDKNAGTRWTAEDEDQIPTGEYRSDGEYVIYDLGASHQLRVIQFTTDSKSDPYGYQIWTSDSGTSDADFNKLIPETGDIQLSKPANTEFQAHEIAITLNARYVKLIGFGRFNAAGDARASKWMNFTQIEFYKEKD